MFREALAFIQSVNLFIYFQDITLLPNSAVHRSLSVCHTMDSNIANTLQQMESLQRIGHALKWHLDGEAEFVGLNTHTHTIDTEICF